MRGSGSQARLIEDFLRREYGVKRVDIEHRSKHAKLHWTHEGSAYSYLCSRNTTSDGHAAIQNARSNIRKMMRGPAFNPVLEEGTVEEMMQDVRERAAKLIAAEQEVIARQAEPAPETAKIWPVLAGAYNASPAAKEPTLNLMFPAGIAKEMPTFEIEAMDPEHWKLTPNGPRKWSMTKGKGARTNITCWGSPPFASIRCDAIQADGEVLVYVPLSQRRPPVRSPHYKRPAFAVPAPRQPQTEEKIAMHQRPVPHPMPPLVEVPPMEFRMRVILEQARELEKTTPYRLIRQDDRLVWQAPVIA